MPRDSRVYLDDILEAVGKIERYVDGYTKDDFLKDGRTRDATLRNLEIIGEAVKNIPSGVLEKNPDIEWKKIMGLRDILAHAYFGVNLEVVWDVVKNRLPELKTSVSRMMARWNEP